MESLETTAEVKSSTEGKNRHAPNKCTSFEMEAKGRHQQLQEGHGRDTCGFKKLPDSGKLQKLEDPPPQIQSTKTRDNEASSYPLQATSLFPIGRQKPVGQVVSAQTPGICGPAANRKTSGSPEQQCSPSGMDLPSETGCKVEQKPQKPGKYVCGYCGRACAKPSVLKKHIRSHTGERPYPCVPCGFSFKTKSNLYKHRKSHAHSVKAGSLPLSEVGSYNAHTDQGSFEGEGELFSDAEQSTDTDEDALNDPLLLLDSPVEGSDNTAVKVLNLIAQKKGSMSMSAQEGLSHPQEINASPTAAEANRAIQSCTIKQRLALRLSEKRSSDSEHNLSLPSQSSKGSTDSGYFSRSESAEHQTSPPNTNAKSYQEIMFGKCYRPSPKQTTAFVSCSTDSSDGTGKHSQKGVSRVFTQEKDPVESIKINNKSFPREEVKDPQLDSGSDMGLLIRSNSMPTSSAVCLTMPQALRGSHSFDERTSNGGMRRLRRQAAFELSPHDGHVDTDSHGRMSESGVSPSAVEMDIYTSVASSTSHQRHAMELATRKRRKEKREEEDLPGQYEVHHKQCEEMSDPSKDYDSKKVSQGAAGCIKGLSSMPTQPDREDMDISGSHEMSGRKTLGHVISVIQHTNSINRLHTELSDSYKYHGQRKESISSYQSMEESYEAERGNSGLRQSFQMGPKLVRQPNIQVPEIRVTVEPDSPEKAPEVQVVREPEKHVEEFQWPQRSETLAQFPPEKLPPKKKRLRLADIEHSSGESSFESACTSLSRSPSQDSNLSYSSTFSFDRDDSLKSVSPARQDEFGKPLELLAVPGSGHSLSVLNQRQQHEMRRSSSEQAPCNLRKEFPEVRSISFDYGSLSPTSKLRLMDIGAGHSAMKERRRGNLVRQESLNMDTDVTQVPSQVVPQYLSSNSPPFPALAALPQNLPIFSTGNPYPQLSHPSLLVPVRIQTHVPCYGSLTYTSVSQIFDNQHGSLSSAITASLNQCLSGNLDPSVTLAPSRPSSTFTLNVEALDLSSAKLKTGIPLSLTSRTISTTNASSGGANKRMLSPASSLDLFIEVKQQKRVKEERMFGQIVEELSAVELGKSHLNEDKGQNCEMLALPTPHTQNDSRQSTFITLQHKVTEATDHSVESAMESSPLETSSPPYSMISVSEAKEAGTEKRMHVDLAAQLVPSGDILISDAEHSGLLSQFPSLRTTTGVSWCFLNYTKPSFSHSSAPFSSVYSTWCVSSHNPNPLELSTSAALALLQSKQRGDKVIYTVAAMCQPGKGTLVSALILWRQTAEQRKPEPKEVDVTYGKKVKDTSFRLKTAKEEWKEREATATQAAPTRIKIFEGGYKSNEDYVYVRGRGRGKYICEECGIRCKKPSMLKKHIRTHTDVRPYICKVCNFAFKTKGNLTKHMKSKAHMKKCLELGVSVTMDETELQEHDDIQHESKAEVCVTTKHQFSDAEDSDGMDEEVDEMDEEEEDDDEYEGDSTPKLRSRSTSPQPCGVTSLSVTATAAIHGCSLTSLPGSDGRQQPPSRRTGSESRAVFTSDPREKSVDEDSLTLLCPEQASFLFDPYSSCLLSPGWESPIREPSPSRLRYPSPRRELSQRGRSSPRWDTSPLRPGSPSFTPIQHLSPGSIERPVSPGADLAGKRESAVRGRQRVVLRAISPRRGSHQHKGVGDKTRHQAKIDMAQQPGLLDMELDQRGGLAPSQPGAASSQPQNLLSHLPLHSQQQAFSLLPVVPVGGVQMLHSPPSSSTDVTPSSVSSPQSLEGQRCSSREGSVQGPELGEEDVRGQPSPHQAAQETTLDPGVSHSRQEENVQTCLKAIASLKITTEDPH